MESCLASSKTTSPTPVSVSTTPLTPRVPVTTRTTVGETSVTTTDTPGSSLIVTVQTNANTYEVGDSFIVTVFVDDGEGYPVPGASVSLIFSESRTGFRNSASGVTDSNGKYSMSRTWSENDTGTITITGTASKTSYTGSTGSTSVAVESGPSLTGSLQAHFSASPTSGISPLEVHFTDRSTGKPTRWKWEFGDGHISTDQNPTHTYHAIEDILGSTDYFMVTLTVWDSSGSYDIMTKVNYIVVYPSGPPHASFSASPSSGTAPLRVEFMDSSSGSISRWHWDFGDGSKRVITDASSPSHTYDKPGNYTVRLIVDDTLGRSDSASRTISVRSATGGVGQAGGDNTNADGGKMPPSSGDGSLIPGEIGPGLAAGIAAGIGASLGAGGIIGWKGQGGGGTPPPPPGTTPPGRKRPRPKRKTSVPSKEIPSEDRFIEISPGEFAHVNDRTGEVKLEDGTVITKDDLRDRWRAENDRALKNSDARFKKKQTIYNVAIPALKAINLGSDLIIGTLGKVTGPAGAALDTAYGVTKTFVSELSEGSGLKNATLSAGAEYLKGKAVGVISDKVPGLGGKWPNLNNFINTVWDLPKKDVAVPLSKAIVKPLSKKWELNLAWRRHRNMFLRMLQR